MKKFKITIFLVIIIIMSCLSNVFAATIDATADVKIDTSKNYKPGDTVTVILSATCEQGLSYVGTEIEYDKNVLTLQSATSASEFKNYALDTEKEKVEVLINTNQIVKQADVYTIVFKVNENATSGTTKISTTSIEIMDINNSKKTLEKIEKSITIQKEETSTPQITLTSLTLTKAADKLVYDAGEKFDTKGMIVTASYSDGSSKNVTDYTYTPTAELSINDNKVTVSYTENGITKTVEQNIIVSEIQKENNNITNNPSTTNNDSNNTNNNSTTTSTSAEEKNNKSNNTLPYTGQNIAVILSIAVFVGFMSVISYLGYTKYNGIK